MAGFPRTHRRGLTLIELLVVLAILATLTVVAVTSTTGLLDQGRYEATQRTLENVRSAVLGRQPGVGEDPTGIPPGFVADVGRLPLATMDLDLSELIENPNGLPAFGIQPPPGDPTVEVLAGWRGPYLQLPVGTNEVTDGYGRTPGFFQVDGTAVTDAAHTIAVVQTLGADAAVDTVSDPAEYEADRELVFERTTAPIVAALHQGQVTIDVTTSSAATGTLVVRVYGPRDGAAVTLAEETVDPITPDTIYSVTFTGALPIGPKVVRAYEVTTAPATAEDAINVNDAGVRESRPMRFRVLRGATAAPAIEVQN